MGQYNWPMPGDADQGRTATVSQEVRIMGNNEGKVIIAIAF